MVKPYDKADEAHTTSMEYVKEDDSGDRFFKAACQNETRPTFPALPDQAYFYRAMQRVEAIGWLAAKPTAALDPEGHQGWASYRDYSLPYLTRLRGYTHLLEVHAPDFVGLMMGVGFKSGKAEVGDLSWGIGGKSSNGHAGNKDQNAKLLEVYAENCNEGVAVKHTSVKGGLRAMAKAVAPQLFLQSIKGVKLVYLRSQKP